MNQDRVVARTAGILFLVALVTDLIGGGLVTRVIHAPDYLTSIYSNRLLLISGMVLELIAAAAVVGIPVVLFSALKKHGERAALGYAGFRIVEAVTIVIYAFSLPALLILSQEYVKAGGPDAPYYRVLGSSLMAESYWVYPMITVFFSLGAILFYSLLYKARLIPRFIPVWGLIGIALLLVGTMFGVFGYGDGYSVVPEPGIMLYAGPIALNEVFLAVWLIARGFNQSAIVAQDQG